MPAPAWPSSPEVYPDAELIVSQVLQPLVDTGNVDTETPPDLAARLDFIRVRRIGGSDDGWNDRVVLDIDVYSGMRSDGLGLSEKIRQLVTAPKPIVVAAGTVDRASTLTAPIEVPRHSDSVRHWTATYELIVRRP